MKDIDRGCTPGDEWFPEGGLAEHNKKFEANKGDLIHQFTVGASGKNRYPLCQSHYDKSHGGFKYAGNSMGGFALVTVTPEEFNVKFKGVSG